MSQPQLLVQSSYLATLEQPESRNLDCGKFENKLIPETFAFFLIELINPLSDSKVLKKITQILENHIKLSVKPIQLDDFEKILHAINEALGRLAESSDDSWLGNLNAIIGIVNGTEISLAQTGNISGYIFRKNKISAMTERYNQETNPHPLKTFSDITSGDLIENDQIIFGNEALFDHISLDRLRNLTKNESIKDESFELVSYLKKARAFDVNAVLIGTGDPENTEDLPEIIFIDEPNEDVKVFTQKYLVPFWNGLKSVSATTGKFIYKNFRILAKQAEKSWKEKYGPKTAQLLKSGKQSIGKALSEAKKGKPQMQIEGQDDLKKLRIRAIPYSKFNSGSSSHFLKNLLALLSGLKIIFHKEFRKFLYISVVILILLVAYWKIKDNNDKRSEKTHQIQVINAIDQAEETFAKAKEDLALGKQNSSDEFRSALALATTAKEAPANQDRANKLIRDINTILDEQIKTVRFYDAASFALPDSTNNFVLVGSEIYTINPDGKIYMADTRDKEAKLVGSIGKGNGNAINLDYSSALKKLLILTDKYSLLAFDPATKLVESLKVTDSTSWENTIAIASYATNIYLLDPTAGEVWKHTQQDTGYNKGSKYLDTRKVSLKNAIDFAVDGNIYVLQQDGTLLKFVKGALEQDFALTGIPKPDDKIMGPAKVITTDEMNSIFILDKTGNRIIKFDKSGEYTNQYIFDGIKIDDFIVNAKLQKIWALSGGKVYEGNL